MACVCELDRPTYGTGACGIVHNAPRRCACDPNIVQMPGCVSKTSGSPKTEARPLATVARSPGARLPAAHSPEVRAPAANRRTRRLLATLVWFLCGVLP